MKKLEFKTSNGDFILKDVPKELVEFTFSESTRLTINGVKYQPCGIVKYMTEEQFSGVVDSITWRYTSGGSNTVYRNYLCNNEISGSGVLESAKESFESLINSLGWYLLENPVKASVENLPAIEQAHRQLDADWQEAESKTLYNPVLLKKV